MIQRFNAATATAGLLYTGASPLPAAGCLLPPGVSGTLSQRCDGEKTAPGSFRNAAICRRAVRRHVATLRRRKNCFGTLSQRCDGEKIASGRFRNAARCRQSPARHRATLRRRKSGSGPLSQRCEMSPGCSASCRNAATATKLLRDACATLRRRPEPPPAPARAQLLRIVPCGTLSGAVARPQAEACG
jgi:hypothetical protein